MKTISLFLIVIVATAVQLSGQLPAAQQPAAKKITAPSAPTINRVSLHPALIKAKAPDIFKVHFTTIKGDFVVKVDRDWSPLGADRF
jgi:hypothetical protein